MKYRLLFSQILSKSIKVQMYFQDFLKLFTYIRCCVFFSREYTFILGLVDKEESRYTISTLSVGWLVRCGLT